MTIGIYRLIFSNTDKCYIGQSINIEHRYKQHLNSFIVGNANNKMQEAYLLFGLPILDILCECSIDNLDKTETEAIEIFNSVHNGFNIVPSATSGVRGDSNPKSKYTNKQILAVAELLSYSANTGTEISRITGVHANTVRDIACLNGHLWISEVQPELYQKLKDLVGTRKNLHTIEKRGIIYPPIISPDGIVYSNISNLKQFCEEHNVDRSQFRRVLKGTNKTCAGWKLTDG